MKFAPLALLFCVCGLCSRRNALTYRLGRQNLAALGTTAGQNLAAVGSSHSLTETVNLGTVTAAGLVGTLHSDTPPMMKFYAEYRRSRYRNPCFCGTNTVVPMYYNRKGSAGQPLFSVFSAGCGMGFTVSEANVGNGHRPFRGSAVRAGASQAKSQDLTHSTEIVFPIGASCEPVNARFLHWARGRARRERRQAL